MDRANVKWEEKERNNNGNNRARQASENQWYSLKLSRIVNINKDYDGGKWCIKCPITKWFVRDEGRGNDRQY